MRSAYLFAFGGWLSAWISDVALQAWPWVAVDTVLCVAAVLMATFSRESE